VDLRTIILVVVEHTSLFVMLDFCVTARFEGRAAETDWDTVKAVSEAVAAGGDGYRAKKDIKYVKYSSVSNSFRRLCTASSRSANNANSGCRADISW